MKRCEDLILGCFNIHLFMGSGECCRTFLTPTITPSGICFWGNFTPIFNQRMETAQTGLSLMLSSPRGTAAFDFDIVQDDFFTISSGLTLSLLSNVTQPSIHINEVIPIGSGDHVSVAVDYSVLIKPGVALTESTGILVMLSVGRIQLSTCISSVAM
ncbi:uncharacterized protein [Penaeus vannamei]|uniref:uncharacterized protein n=1 Tax=Penaeus vannamei TaxID=6689 RepID=UPI00387F7446